MAWLKAIADGHPKLQDSPGLSRPAFSSLFCNSILQPVQRVQDEKVAQERSALSFEKAKTEF